MASFLANSLATLVARLIVPAFSFAISVTIARLYGAETLGIYVQLMALTVIFQTMATAGIPLLLTRDIAAVPENTGDHLVRAQSFALVSGFAATIAFLVYALLVLPKSEMWAAVVLAVTVLPSAWMAIQEGFFMATRAHHRVTIVAFVENTLKLVLAGAAFVVGSGIVAICAAIGAARLVAAQVGRRLMASAGEPLMWRWSVGEALSFGRLVAPFAVLLTVSMIYFRVDIILVGFLCDGTETGLYGAAITVYTVSLLLLSSVMSAVYPRLSAAFQDSQTGFVAATTLSVKLLAVGMVPVAVLMICFADWALVVVFGETFVNAAPVLRLLAASLPLHAVNGTLGQALQAGQHQTSMVRIVSLGLAAHIVGIVLLVPILGIEGAAVSVLLSSTLVTLCTVFSFNRNVSRMRPGSRAVVAVVAVVVPISMTLLAPSPWVVPAGAVALVAFAVTVLTGALSRSELNRLARAVSPSRAPARP